MMSLIDISELRIIWGILYYETQEWDRLQW